MDLGWTRLSHVKRAVGKEHPTQAGDVEGLEGDGMTS